MHIKLPDRHVRALRRFYPKLRAKGAFGTRSRINSHEFCMNFVAMHSTDSLRTATGILIDEFFKPLYGTVKFPKRASASTSTHASYGYQQTSVMRVS